MKTRIIAFISIFILLFTYSSIYATSKQELIQEKEQKQQEKEQKQQEIKEIKNEKQSISDEVTNLSAQIASLNSEIASLNSQLDEINSNISDKEAEIEEKEKKIEETQELLKKRLIAMYKAGGISYLDVLLGSSNYLDMLSSYDVIKEIADADNELINKISTQKKELEDAKQELEEQKNQVASIKAEKDSKNAELNAKKSEKNEKYVQLSSEEKKKEDELEAYDAAIAQVEAQLAAIARQAQAQLSSVGGNGLNFDGSFRWPCDNKTVTSTLKWRWGRLHKGIDIGASYENVYASASGYAYIAENPGGYGHYIMIFHGGNYVTLYGHLNSYNISSGQYVSQGQVIATSGNSGSSTGPHLHFEIRNASSMSSFFSASPLNPLDYLPGGYTIL